MNLRTLDEIAPYSLGRHQDVYRVQRWRADPDGPARGPLRVAPAGIGRGRFDLPDQRVAYFADSPETAAFETIGRRELTFIALDGLRSAELLCVKTTRELTLVDLTRLAPDWPVLQSMRYGPSQALAAEAAAEGFDGVVYRSPQHYAGTCFAVFEHAFGELRRRWHQRLIEPGSGNVHRVVQTVAERGGLPIA